MLFHLHFTEETVQLRLLVGKMLPWCHSSFFFLENFPAREREIELKYPHLAQITKSLSFPYFIAISLPVQFFWINQVVGWPENLFQTFPSFAFILFYFFT